MNRNKKSCVIYVRVSTDKQIGNDHFSLESQIEMCQNYARLYSYEVKGIFKDEGLSGRKTDKRVGLENALKTMESGDMLLVYSISRLSRNMNDFTFIIDKLEKENKVFASVSEQFQNNTPQGKLIMNILASFSQFESQQTGERVSNVMNSLKSYGRVFGNISYGFKVNSEIKGMLLDNEEEKKIINFIFEENKEGNSISKIVIKLKEKEYKKRNGKDFEYQTVKNILDNYQKNKERIEKNNQHVLSRLESYDDSNQI